MSSGWLEFLRHISTEARYLERATAGIELADLLADETLRRAIVRSLEIIGEASKKIPRDIRNQYSDIEWARMAGMRDRLIHGYFGVDYEIVFEVVRTKIPHLRRRVEEILANESSSR